jgi:FO synthase
LHPLVTNIQTSWVKMGPDGVKTCLRAGANDLGGTLMDETITRSAGAAIGQEMTPAAMEGIIRSIGRIPRQRDYALSDVPDERYRASFALADAQCAGSGPAPCMRSKSYCSNDSTIL